MGISGRSRVRRAAAACVAAVIFMSTQAWAQQTAPVVLYSYTKLAVGNDVQYVLVPNASSNLQVPEGAELSPAIVNGAFNELRNLKRTTYGETSLDVSTKSLAKGQATVKLDGEREKYHPIIVSEIVYTLTQLGLTEISVPGYSKKPLSRADIEFSAYRLVVPAWRALPPRQIPAALIVMPDGVELASEDYQKKVEGRDPQILAMLETYLKHGDSRFVLLAIASLPGLKLDKGPDMILPLLSHKEAPVRTAALGALAGVERDDVLDGISDVMDKDKDKEVALAASSILGASKNKKYSVRALFFALRGDVEGPAIKAIEMLAASKEAAVAPELVKASRRDNDKIAAAAIKALADLKLNGELVDLFSDSKVSMERRMSAAALVATGGDNAQKFKALSLQTTLGTGEVALTALAAIKAFKDPDPRLAIEAVLKHPEAAARHAAAEALGEIKSPESLSALADAGTKPEDEETIQSVASTIMATLTLQDVLGYTSNRNIVLQRVAYLALGVKTQGGGGGKQVFDALKKGVESKDAGIRGASARGLGSFKDDKALELVVSLGKDPEGAVRRDVARGLGDWPAGTQSELLLGYLGDTEGEVIQAAVAALHKRKEDSAYKPILKLTRGATLPHPGARGAVMKALVALAPEPELQNVISVLSGGLFDPDREVKILAMDLLGQYDNPAAVTGLAALINDPVEEFRVLSVLALGKTGSNDAIELIASVVGDQSVAVRVAAMQAFGTLGKKAGADIIKAQLAVESDISVMRAGEAAMKKLK